MKMAVRMFFVFLVVGLVFGCGEKKAGIEGKLLDGKGQPMSGVKVIAKQVKPIKGFEQFETTTGSDGAFRFKGLFPASEYSISQPTARWTTTVQSGPEGQTSMLPAPITVRFTISSQGIATDSKTGFQWVPAPKQAMDWVQATNYAQNLPLGGGGWRLPTRSELKSIYDKSMEGHADPAFNIRGGWVWTSEAQGNSSWAFRFGLGDEYAFNRDFSLYGNRVLAVRSPK
jgi:hypothetical protein